LKFAIDIPIVIARKNEEFCDDPIAPDVETVYSETDAMTWLLNYHKQWTY